MCKIDFKGGGAEIAGLDIAGLDNDGPGVWNSVFFVSDIMRIKWLFFYSISTVLNTFIRQGQRAQAKNGNSNNSNKR